MDILALFGLSILMGFVAFGLVTKLYTWPRPRLLPRDAALLPLVVPHAFRFVGLSSSCPAWSLQRCRRPSPLPRPTAIWLQPCSPSWRPSHFPGAGRSPSRSCGCSTSGARPTSCSPFTRGCLGRTLIPECWGRVLHSDGARAALAHHAWADFLAARSSKAVREGSNRAEGFAKRCSRSANGCEEARPY
jgi:hypothetical protein